MKKFFPLLLIAIMLVTGCTIKTPTIEQGASEPASTPESKAEEEVPRAWTGKVWVETTHLQGDFTFVIIEEGEFSFTIHQGDLNADITGSGTATTHITASGTCSGEWSFDTSFLVSGSYNLLAEQYNPIFLDFYDVSPPVFSITLECDSPEGPYPQDWYEQSYIGEGGFNPVGYPSFNPKAENGASDTMTFTPDYGGEGRSRVVIYEAGASEPFDFDVDVSPHILSIMQGETATIPVTVKLLRGEPQSVTLTVTKWDYTVDISAWFADPQVIPTEAGTMTTLYIKTTCNTPPDEYLHTVQGEAEGTFRTSVDTVNLEVTANPACS